MNAMYNTISIHSSGIDYSVSHHNTRYTTIRGGLSLLLRSLEIQLECEWILIDYHMVEVVDGGDCLLLPTTTLTNPYQGTGYQVPGSRTAFTHCYDGIRAKLQTATIKPAKHADTDDYEYCCRHRTAWGSPCLDLNPPSLPPPPSWAVAGSGLVLSCARWMAEAHQ